MASNDRYLRAFKQVPLFGNVLLQICPFFTVLQAIRQLDYECLCMHMDIVSDERGTRFANTGIRLDFIQSMRSHPIHMTMRCFILTTYNIV